MKKCTIIDVDEISLIIKQEIFLKSYWYVINVCWVLAMFVGFFFFFLTNTENL